MTQIQLSESLWTAFAWIGAGVVTVLLVGILAVVSLYGFVFVREFFPCLHFGNPGSKGEVCFYDVRDFSIRRNGQQLTAPGTGKLIQKLKISWWLGMSNRSKPAWFVGLIRWKPEQ